MTTNPAVCQLGWLGLEVADLDGWESIATEVFGLASRGRDDDGRLLLAMDENHHRLSFVEGPRDDIDHVGWLVADRGALGAIAERLGAQGYAVECVGSGDAARRGVDALVRTRDPDGVIHEIATRAPRTTDVAVFHSPRPISGFVTGDLGLGHFVLAARDTAASTAFFVDGLGLRVSDYIDLDTGDATPTRASFFHCGPRHHSLAIAGFAMPKKLHHVMFEVRDLDDVGMTYDLCEARGVPISAGLGRHTNDRMTSFYAVSPSGFQIEYGCGGIEIDDATWQVRTYGASSTWGHRPPQAA